VRVCVCACDQEAVPFPEGLLLEVLDAAVRGGDMAMAQEVTHTHTLTHTHTHTHTYIYPSHQEPQ
jgi:hypothetical protein